jgi:hypothetical protein
VTTFTIEETLERFSNNRSEEAKWYWLTVNRQMILDFTINLSDDDKVFVTFDSENDLPEEEKHKLKFNDFSKESYLDLIKGVGLEAVTK